jgi:PQQ-like domain
MNRKAWSLILLISISAVFVASLPLAADWPTFGHDPQRSGWAPEEDTFSPGNVAGLELKWKTKVKNEPKSLTALTAPVVASKVATPTGVKTLVYVGGSDNHVFALDAADGKVIWNRTFDAHVLPKDEGMWLCPNGINATPTIDRSTNTIYAIAVDGRLYGMDLGTGEVTFGPVEFVPSFSKNWSLNQWGSEIFTTLSQGCAGAPSGIYSMDVGNSMQPVHHDLFVARKFGAGIWGRGGAVVGRNGRVYASTGDGSLIPSRQEYGSAVIGVTAEKLEVADYFTPPDYRDVNVFDLDLASASPVWFSFGKRNLLAAGGKEGTIYLLDADSLGGPKHESALYTARLTNDQRSFEGEGIWGALSAWRDSKGQTWVYAPTWGPVSKDLPKFPATDGDVVHGSVMAFKVISNQAANRPALEPAWISRDLDVPEPVAIANGVVFVVATGENPTQTEGSKIITKNGRLLTDAERAANTHNAVLYALDAATGKVLFDSGSSFTTWVHFSGLAVAGGRVYAVDHDSQLYCFGLKGK